MTEYNNNNTLGWDDAIEDIPQEEFVILPPGEYAFTVTSMERREIDTKKLGHVRVADVQMVFNDGQMESSGKASLILHPKTLWKIREFFKSIGEKVEDGKPFVPRWNSVPGSTGRCKVKNGEFIGRNGDKFQTNEVEKFLPAAEIDDSEAPF